MVAALATLARADVMLHGRALVGGEAAWANSVINFVTKLSEGDDSVPASLVHDFERNFRCK